MKKNLSDIKPIWTIGYIVSIIGPFIMLLARGIVQGLSTAPSSTLDSALSGIVGLTHISLAIFVSGIFIILIKLSSNYKIIK